MTAEIERYDDTRGALAERRPPELAILRPPAVGRLEDWAKSAHAAHAVATSLVKTSFVPKAFRDKAHEATAAILAGDEVGLSPMASLRAFDIIEGTAAPRAITHRAVVQAAGHEIWLVEATDNRCVMRGNRRGSDHTQEVVWTFERARSLNLAGKDNWKKQPKAMLIARATSEICRLVASDALMGMGYSIEELADEAPVGVEPDGPAAPRRTAQRRAKAAAPAAAVPGDVPDGQSAPDAQPPVAAAGLPPLPGEDGYDDTDARGDVTATAVVSGGSREGAETRQPTEDAGPDGGTAPADPESQPRAADAHEKASSAQTKKLFAILRGTDIDTTADRHKVSGRVLGREITSWAQLSKDDASVLIDTFDQWQSKGELVQRLTDLLSADPDDAPPASPADEGA